MNATWLFGYGSIIWRADFAFSEQRLARVHNWERRFWQGSHDHRGLAHAPGRVVTLIQKPGGAVDGVAYRIATPAAAQILSRLDQREKNGYVREEVRLEFRDGALADGIAYIAAADNHAFLGPAPIETMLVQIRASAGPSGTNLDYLLRLAAALREHGIDDAHVFELERHLMQGSKSVQRD